jgi:hypothetical protein
MLFSANHVWAEKYDCDATVDEVAQKVATSVQAEIRIYDETFLNSRASNRSGTELVRLAWTAMYKLTATELREARSHIDGARVIIDGDLRLDQIVATIEFHDTGERAVTPGRHCSRGGKRTCFSARTTDQRSRVDTRRHARVARRHTRATRRDSNAKRKPHSGLLQISGRRPPQRSRGGDGCGSNRVTRQAAGSLE